MRIPANVLLVGIVSISIPLQAHIDEDHVPEQIPAEASPTAGSDPIEKHFFKTFLKDEVQIWTSPFKRSSYSSRAFPKYAVPFLLTTGTLIATDHLTSNVLPNTPAQSRWSLRVSQVGAPYTLAGMAGAMYLSGYATGNKKAREVGFLGAEAILHSQIVTFVIKSATQRERPLDFQTNRSGGTGFGGGGDSFPSGHSSGSFALATVFAYEYGHDHRWVPFASYGLASLVAASRLSGQKHWMSDIFVGSTIGFLVGRYVYKTHHDPRIDGRTPTRAQLLIPEFGMTSHSAAAAWKW